MSIVDLHPLERFEGIDLAAINEVAAHQRRVDRKYVLPLADLTVFLAGIDQARVLTVGGARDDRYTSHYLDTPDLISYHAAARRRPRRFKVRLRHYASTDTHFLEVKARTASGMTDKHRMPVSAALALDAAGQAFVNERLCAHRMPVPATLVPSLTSSLITRYDRTTLYLPADGSRVTVDLGLSFAADGVERKVGDVAIVETKSGGTVGQADRLLHSLGHREVAMSKYGVGIAVLHPELATAAWSRTITQLF